MSVKLINLQNKRISELEKKLEIERTKRDNLIINTKSEELPPLRFVIEKTHKGWNVLTCHGLEFFDLPALKVCLDIINPHYTKAQFRNQSVEIYDANTKTLYQDYRVYTEWAMQAEQDQKSMVKNIKRTRRNQTKKVQTKVKQIDSRIFDRTY
tara:strand:- start:242 stop:700 length:459 start_codon:yes stop_codon:yes gene_type:complete